LNLNEEEQCESCDLIGANNLETLAKVLIGVAALFVIVGIIFLISV